MFFGKKERKGPALAEVAVHLGNLDGILLDGVDNERPEAARHRWIASFVHCPAFLLP